MDELLRDYPVVIEVPVWWGEMDAFQHLNNTEYFRHFESARVAYFLKLDPDGALTARGEVPMLAAASCEFRRPIVFPDTVRVGCRVTSIAEDRFFVGLRTVSLGLGKVAAEGASTLVAYNMRERRKSPELMALLKTRIEALEGREF